ncbi:uncharacterized protein BYT42DRAFT_568429 [Radiomyces spectabilis]|uniref:uncharacterized protein n=1 Tax=Radiomyces spectabilis TaxID=64574 RepID=UPI00221E4C72|nr:uncharacterized protein BYT42DRAFT_568429 [Radiomyces spectabilis]KAI8379331.1 hypothetical protein BYT42DRAFT_568429 [Radiomyces spectabilis]
MVEEGHSTLISFNFHTEEPNVDNEGVFSKLFGKVKTAVSGQHAPNDDDFAASHDSVASFPSSRDITTMSTASLTSSNNVSESRLPETNDQRSLPTVNDNVDDVGSVDESKATSMRNNSYSAPRSIQVTSPSPPTSTPVKDSVVINFPAPSLHFDIIAPHTSLSTKHYHQQQHHQHRHNHHTHTDDPHPSASDFTRSNLQYPLSVSRLSQADENQSMANKIDHFLPMKKTASIDSDSQSVVTTFSISNTNSLNRILARLRGQKNDKEYWMPDERCKECYKCRKPFTLLRRKHHCRSCGQIFCAKCASHIIPRKMYKQKGPVRVCNFCYAEHHTGQSTRDSSNFAYMPDMASSSSVVKEGPSTIKHNYAPVIPSQKPPSEAPKMQIPTTALKQARITYGDTDSTTFALELPATETDALMPSSYHLHDFGRPQSPRMTSVNAHSVPSSRQLMTVAWDTDKPTHAEGSGTGYTDVSLKRLLDAGTSLLKSRPRSNTSSSAPLEDTRHLQPSADGTSSLPFRGNSPSPYIGTMDRGGGTVVEEHQLSPFKPHVLDQEQDADSDNHLYDVWNRPTGHNVIASFRGSRMRMGSMLHRRTKLVESDDEAYDTKLRVKRTEELRGKPTTRERSYTSYRRLDTPEKDMDHRRRLHRQPSHIQINVMNLPQPDVSLLGGENWSPNPFLSPYSAGTPEDPFSSSFQDYSAVRNRLLMPRQRRISTPPPNVELSYSALLHARNILKQLMDKADLSELSAKKQEEWQDIIMNLLLKVTDHVRPDVRSGDDMDVRHYVKIKKLPGGLPSDSFYVKGVVCSKNVAHKKMVRNISHPRILILLFSLDYSRVEMENQLLSITPVISQERDHISKLVGRIIALRPSLLLVKSTVSRLALKYLLDANIPVIHNVKYSVIEAVARCTQASIIPSVDKLQLGGLSFGRCGSFEIRTLMHEWIPNRRKTFLVFDDCPPELGGTIVLRGATEDTLRTIKRLIDFMVFVVNNLKLETSLLRDSFAKNRGVEQLTAAENASADKQEDTDPANGSTSARQSTVMRASESERTDSTLITTKDALKDDAASNAPSDGIDGSFKEKDGETSLSQLIDMYRDTILSVSQYVTFPPPYLLMRLKATEDRLAKLTLARRPWTGKAQEISAPSTRSTVEPALPSIDTEYEHLIAKHYQLARAWDAYVGQDPDYISPFYHQSIVVLYSNVCTVTTVPCQGPQIRIFQYYRHPSDMPLGQYVIELCADATQPCPSLMCEHSMLDHYRSYAHGNGRVNVMIEKFECPQPGMADKLLMWSYCKECDRPTPVIPVSENTWNYSFGKFIELSLYQTNVHCRADICPHDISRHHVRYFGFMNLAVRFQYEPIGLLEVSVPPMKLFMLSQVQANLKEEETKSLRHKINKFYQSISERNKGFPFDLVDPRKLDACKAELQEMSNRGVGEKKQILQVLQNIFATTEASDTLTINWVRRILYQQCVQWDMEYADLVSIYLQPERELRKLTTSHLRKMFPTDMMEPAMTNMDDERTKRATEITDLPLLGIALDSQEEASVIGYCFESSDTQESPFTMSLTAQPELSSSPTDTASFNTNLTAAGTLDHPTELDVSSGEMESKQSLLKPDIRRQLSLDLLHKLDAKGRGTALDSDRDRQYLRRRHTGPSAHAGFSPSRIPVPHLGDYKSKSSYATPVYEPYTPLYHSMKSPVKAQGKYRGRRKVAGANPHGEASTHRAPINEHAQDKAPHERRKAERQFRSRLPRKKTYIQVYTQANDLVKEDLDDEFLTHDVDDQGNDEDNRCDEAVDMLRYRRRSTGQGLKPPRLDLLSSNDDEEAEMDYFSPVAPYLYNFQVQPQTVTRVTCLETVDSPDEPLTTFPMTLGASVSPPSDFFLPPAYTLLACVPAADGDESDKVPSPTDAQQERARAMAEALDSSRQSPEKTSFMKTITNFLTDSGATNLLPLENPIHSTEHILPDSFVVVREDEPSTIIAYTLNCEDYLLKLNDIQEMAADDTSSYDAESSTISLAGMPLDAEGIDPGESVTSTAAGIEETLLRESGTHMRYNFSDGTTKFFCKIFFSEQFDALRRNCGCDESYILSLASCVKWDSSGGKSGSAFLKTKDDRLLMKQMSRYELDAFLRFAPAYFQYMSEAFFRELPTVLAKIFGFYSIGYKNSTTGKSMRMDVLVMENLFYQRNIKKIFDLKGSMRNRHVRSTGKQDEVLLDENLVELIYQSPLFIRAHSKEILRSSLHNDTLFLSSRGVMDYSLLVGIDEERQELVVGIVGKLSTSH